MWIATMVKRGALLAAGLALAACQSLVPGPPAGPELAAQTLQVSPRVVLAGALSKDAVTTLRATQAIVIDLRHPQEGATDEARLMARHGIPWINLPQGRDTPSVEDVAYLDDVLAAWPTRGFALCDRQPGGQVVGLPSNRAGRNGRSSDRRGRCHRHHGACPVRNRGPRREPIMERLGGFLSNDGEEGRIPQKRCFM